MKLAREGKFRMSNVEEVWINSGSIRLHRASRDACSTLEEGKGQTLHLRAYYTFMLNAVYSNRKSQIQNLKSPHSHSMVAGGLELMS